MVKSQKATHRLSPLQQRVHHGLPLPDPGIPDDTWNDAHAQCEGSLVFRYSDFQQPCKQWHQQPTGSHCTQFQCDWKKNDVQEHKRYLWTYVPMVVFVGHALLLRSVCFDIDDVSYMVIDEKCGQFNGTMFCSKTKVNDIAKVQRKDWSHLWTPAWTYGACERDNRMNEASWYLDIVCGEQLRL